MTRDASHSLTRARELDALGAAIVDLLADRLFERLAPALQPACAADDPWRLLDVEQAAERLGRSTRWVRERLKRGDLPFVKLDGGALAFELEDLRAFARARRVSGQPLAHPNISEVAGAPTLAPRLQVVRDPASANGSGEAIG